MVPCTRGCHTALRKRGTRPQQQEVRSRVRYGASPGGSPSLTGDCCQVNLLSCVFLVEWPSSNCYSSSRLSPMQDRGRILSNTAEPVSRHKTTRIISVYIHVCSCIRVYGARKLHIHEEYGKHNKLLTATCRTIVSLNRMLPHQTIDETHRVKCEYMQPQRSEGFRCIFLL